MRIQSVLLLSILLATPSHSSQPQPTGDVVLGPMTTPAPTEPVADLTESNLLPYTETELRHMSDTDLMALYKQEKDIIITTEEQDEKRLLQQCAQNLKDASWFGTASTVLRYAGKGASTAVSIALSQFAAYTVGPVGNLVMAGINAAGQSMQLLSLKAQAISNDNATQARQIQIDLRDQEIKLRADKADAIADVVHTEGSLIPAPTVALMSVRRTANLKADKPKDAAMVEVPATQVAPIVRKRLLSASGQDTKAAKVAKKYALTIPPAADVHKIARKNIVLNNVDQLTHDWKLTDYADMDWWIRVYGGCSTCFAWTGQILTGGSTVVLTTWNIFAVVTATVVPSPATYAIGAVNMAAVVIQHLSDNAKDAQQSQIKQKQKKLLEEKQNLSIILKEIQSRAALRAAHAVANQPPVVAQPPVDMTNKGKDEATGRNQPSVVVAVDVAPSVVTLPVGGNNTNAVATTPGSVSTAEPAVVASVTPPSVVPTGDATGATPPSATVPLKGARREGAAKGRKKVYRTKSVSGAQTVPPKTSGAVRMQFDPEVGDGDPLPPAISNASADQQGQTDTKK
jgi:hypothetical protein